MITIRLDGPIVPWARPRAIARPGEKPQFFTKSKNRNYMSDLRYAAQQQMNGFPLFTGPIAVKVTADLHVPTSWSKKKRAKCYAGEIQPTKRPDIDNLYKNIDALEGVVFDDDCRITTMRIDKRYSDRPGLTIEIMPFNAEAA